MNEMVIIGKSVSTHGIKGELKVVSDFEYIDKAFVVGNNILINNIEHVISSVRYHKQYILLGIDNLNNINDVLEYVGYNIYIAKCDLHLDNNEYLLKDLIGLKIIDEGKNIGVVSEVVKGNSSNYIRVNDEFLVPIIPEYIINVDLDKKEIKTKNALDLRV